MQSILPTWLSAILTFPVHLGSVTQEQLLILLGYFAPYIRLGDLIIHKKNMFQLAGYNQTLNSAFLPNPWGELMETRDILFSALVGELTINKILLENSMLHQTKTSRATNASSGSNEVQNEEVKEQNNENVEQEDFNLESKNSRESRNGLNFTSQMKNDTKNIPKNYGKAILSFIQKYPKTKEIVESLGVKHPDFLMHVRRLRKKVNSIEGLKKMWGAGNLNHKMKKCIRILSYIFMRKHCLPYIFHSKVRNFTTHIKYRAKLIEGIERPDSFNHIKEY